MDWWRGAVAGLHHCRRANGKHGRRSILPHRKPCVSPKGADVSSLPWRRCASSLRRRVRVARARAKTKTKAGRTTGNHVATALPAGQTRRPEATRVFQKLKQSPSGRSFFPFVVTQHNTTQQHNATTQQQQQQHTTRAQGNASHCIEWQLTCCLHSLHTFAVPFHLTQLPGV